MKLPDRKGGLVPTEGGTFGNVDASAYRVEKAYLRRSATQNLNKALGLSYGMRRTDDAAYLRSG
jgi:hypothetical protein